MTGRLIVVGLVGAAALAGSRVPAQGAQAPGVRFEETSVLAPDGVRLYARILGNGPDTVIVGLATYLAQDLAPLQSGRTLIFYDPRSRGGSDAVTDSSRLGMSFEVADLEAVRAHFRLSRASLVGWSYLGAVVALYAAQYPERVRAVVQVGPMAPRASTSRGSGRGGSLPDSADLAYLAGLHEAGVDVSDPIRYCREVTLRQMLRPMMARPDSAVRTQADPCVHRNEWPKQLFATLRRVIPAVGGVDWDYSQQARRIRAPVLILHGRSDRNAPIEGGRDWAGLMPNATLIELEGVGHGVWVESPSRFFPAVDAFLRAHAR